MGSEVANKIAVSSKLESALKPYIHSTLTPSERRLDLPATEMGVHDRVLLYGFMSIRNFPEKDRDDYKHSKQRIKVKIRKRYLDKNTTDGKQGKRVEIGIGTLHYGTLV